MLKTGPKYYVPSCIVYFFVVLFVVMFSLCICLTHKLLSSKEHCDCPKIDAYYIPNLSAITKYSTEHKLAVLVPYRERFEELLQFVPHLYNFLNKQHIDHDIFILNQIDNFRFNRASLINVGFLQTKANYDYIAMHDVDLLPLNNNLSYAYPAKQPFHVAAPNLHPRYHYEKFVGGILLVNRHHFSLVNGMSNRYWGWGLEDDEFFVRLRSANLSITRPENISTGTNNTFKHIHGRHRKRDTARCFNQREVTRKRDRETGLHDVQYKIESMRSVMISGAPFTVINVELLCDFSKTPWCDCSGSDDTY